MANSVRNLGGGGGLLPCIVVSNGHKFWCMKLDTKCITKLK